MNVGRNLDGLHSEREAIYEPQLAGFEKRRDVPAERLHILFDGERRPLEGHVDTRLLSPLQHAIEKLAHQHRLAGAQFSGEDHHAVPRDPLGENLVESFYPSREERRQYWLRLPLIEAGLQVIKHV